MKPYTPHIAFSFRHTDGSPWPLCPWRRHRLERALSFLTTFKRALTPFFVFVSRLSLNHGCAQKVATLWILVYYQIARVSRSHSQIPNQYQPWPRDQIQGPNQRSPVFWVWILQSSKVQYHVFLSLLTNNCQPRKKWLSLGHDLH